MVCTFGSIYINQDVSYSYIYILYIYPPVPVVSFGGTIQFQKKTSPALLVHPNLTCVCVCGDGVYGRVGG